MKSIAIASAAILTTLSLAAASDPPPAPSTTTAAVTKTAATSTAAPATSTAAVPVQPPADSLAAAAQRANAARGRKKAKISITNDNLSKTGGRITTSSGGGMPLPVTPEATGKTVEQMVAEADAQRKAIAEQEKKKAEEERRKRMERAGNAMDGTALDADEDPALLEHRMAVAAQSASDKPQQTTTQKPPL